MKHIILSVSIIIFIVLVTGCMGAAPIKQEAGPDASAQNT